MFEELAEFIRNKQDADGPRLPTTVDQTLVAAGGTATVRQVAIAFLMEDESQISCYEKRIKDMPLPVLKRHGVVRRNGDLLSLETKKLTCQEASALQPSVSSA